MKLCAKKSKQQEAHGSEHSLFEFLQAAVKSCIRAKGKEPDPGISSTEHLARVLLIAIDAECRSSMM